MGNIVEAYPKPSKKTKGISVFKQKFRSSPKKFRFTHLPCTYDHFSDLEEVVTKGISAKIKPVEPSSKHNDWSTYPFPSP